MKRIDPTATFLRRMGRIALCYVIALQTFLAAYGITVGAAQAEQIGASFVICHGAGGDTTPTPDGRTVPHVPCVLCAMAAHAAALPSGASPTVILFSKLSHRLRPDGTAALVTLPPPRTGLARGPPHFV